MSDYRANVPLAPLTTMRVGGPAAVFAEAESRDELRGMMLDIWSIGEPWLILGGGSNLLVSDEGVPGVVVRVRTAGIEVVSADEFSVVIRVQSGTDWDEVVRFAVANGLAGIEALSGIPGTMGAAPIQNIGAYGQEIGDVLDSVEFLRHEDGAVHQLTRSELGLAYRTSAIKRGMLGAVLSVDLQLAREGSGPEAPGMPVRYAQLASALNLPLGGVASLADVRAAVLALRASKGMVLDPADPDSVSAGSFFVNPIVTETFALQLPSDSPRWPVTTEAPPSVAPLGDEPSAPAVSGEPFLVKLSAAWLIEHAGIQRGFRLPGSKAAVSTKHTLALVNTGGASAAEIEELARFIQTRVQSVFGVNLQPEPTLVGFGGAEDDPSRSATG